MVEYYCRICGVQLAAWERDEFGNECQTCICGNPDPYARS